MTNREDALAAPEAGADAIGFVFVPSSPRAMSRKRVEEILKVLPPTILTVGVVANENPDFLRGLVRVCPLGALQFHGQEPPEEILGLREELSNVKLIKAIRVRDADSLPEIPRYRGISCKLSASRTRIALISLTLESSFRRPRISSGGS